MVFSLHFYILGFASIAVSVATNRLVCLSFGGYVHILFCLLACSSVRRLPRAAAVIQIRTVFLYTHTLYA